MVEESNPKKLALATAFVLAQTLMAVAPRTYLLSASLLLGAVASLCGCNTGAVAIQECRDIEYARCDAASACEVGEVKTEEDVAACRRFYKEQCLHGIAGPKPPPAQAHQACLAAITAAAACANQEKTATPASCSNLPLEQVEGTKIYKDVCDVIGRPWDLLACDYLQAAPDDGAAGSGG